MKSEYIIELDNKNLTKENLIEVKRKFLTGNVIMLVVVFVILLVTLVGIPRIEIFAKIFSSISHVFQIVGLTVYLIATVFLLFYYSGIVLYIIVKAKKNEEWVYSVYTFKKKTDIIAFTSRCLSIFLFILIFFLNPCTVEGDSMNNTFETGDKVICTDVFYYPKKDDVIVFNSYNYSREDSLYIKRVIATEGDVLSYVDGVLYVNGEKEKIQRVDQANFNGIVNGIKRIDNSAPDNFVTVPKGRLVVLGDNREISRDSGEFGPISKDDIYGKVILRVFPFNAIMWF